MTEHPQNPNWRKHTYYARPARRSWLIPRAGRGDAFFAELLSVVGWEDRGRTILTVLNRDEVESLRDALTDLLNAESDMSDST